MDMRKNFFVAICSLLMLSLGVARADDGMWLPSLIGQRIGDMQAKGFKLGAEDIYSVNQASLKDAVVLFGRGCTGEIVSSDGLLLTNHHCGYSQIQSHSSVEHDYLKDGFWAMSRDEELTNPGLTVKILQRMEDVTQAVLAGFTEGSMTESWRDSVVKHNADVIRKEAEAAGKGLKASVEAMYYGNQYFLFVYKEFRDVRLVGAPPSSIGKFGGDTDNWMWPRHTGDFSMFRVYAGEDNMPAGYSPENRPYSPKKFFSISTKGVQEGDFTFIYGFPGSTREYIHSSEVEYISEVSDPARIDIRTRRLEIQKRHMAASQKVRIQYSAKCASVANAWKKWQGEVKGVRKMNTVQKKREYERAFELWAAGSRYEGVTERIAALERELRPYAFARDIYSETAYAVELPKKNLVLKDYDIDIDRESFVVEMEAFLRYVPEEMQPQWFRERLADFGSIEAWSEAMFRSVDEREMAMEFAERMQEWYLSEIRPQIARLSSEMALEYRTYMRGQMEFEKDRDFFPDANLTLRVAYGRVCGYSPADGTWYKPVSTLKGVMEKDNPDIFDYNIPQTLRDIYARGGYEGTPVCFLANNHTTGGNSGSPVINAEGELIGLNFDRVWEGTMSDIVFDPEVCRNISLDIRYALFVIREIGHAGHLIEEMDLR